ncbi:MULTISPECIES: sugar transferase [Exiguobacterium]|uniref:Sugar transferase n=1 Tax=Exiguobacterium sp. (strain ATCC BAA-1283 / AT1b) TaxID=360911 RepID=C4L727_EXISA|nr:MULTISPECIES: sugar transferase [unclassified Exiguobacterium]ACQ70120.1 sugar transferase [Exiguobacterium sp. AT1b]
MDYMTFKRIFDGTLSGVALLLLAPILLLIALLIKIDSRGPVFFKQERIGLRETRFWMYKFRTMHQDTPNDVPTHLFNDSTKHITRVGAFLRKTSLDELPQLVNILKGEMAIVGPRPALWNQDDLVEARRQVGATEALPGLTGWAQVKGRDELPIEVKAKLDGEYVRQMSFWFDLRCIALTVRNVLLREGIVEGAPPPSPSSEEKKMMHVAKK